LVATERYGHGCAILSSRLLRERVTLTHVNVVTGENTESCFAVTFSEHRERIGECVGGLATQPELASELIHVCGDSTSGIVAAPSRDAELRKHVHESIHAHADAVVCECDLA